MLQGWGANAILANRKSQTLSEIAIPGSVTRFCCLMLFPLSGDSDKSEASGTEDVPEVFFGPLLEVIQPLQCRSECCCFRHGDMESVSLSLQHTPHSLQADWKPGKVTQAQSRGSMDEHQGPKSRLFGGVKQAELYIEPSEQHNESVKLYNLP